MTSLTLDALRATAKFYRMKMEEVETQIFQLEGKLPLNDNDMYERAIEMVDKNSGRYAIAWSIALHNGLIQNVERVLESHYNSLVEFFNLSPLGVNINPAVYRIGTVGSIKWKAFVLRVIHYLKMNGGFGDLKEGHGKFDTFRNPDSNTYKITWNAACYLIEH
jgi:hypothetical protein